MKLAGTLFARQARSPRAQRPVRSAAASALLAVTLVVTSALFATLFAMPQPARAAVPVSFKVTGGQEDVDYRLTAYNELYIMTTTLTISTTEPIGADHIVVDTGTTDDPARLTFDGVTIISGDCPINILEGHALELTLAPGSVNSLTMNGSYPRQAIALGAGSSLTVKSGAANPGSLSVVSAARAGAPVIGGSGCAISLEGGLMSISAANSANPPAPDR